MSYRWYDIGALVVLHRLRLKMKVLRSVGAFIMACLLLFFQWMREVNMVVADHEMLSSGYGRWNRPLSRRLDRCDRVIQNESRDPFGGNVYYVTMQITFLTRKFLNGERNLHCDVVHITTKWVSTLTLDCNGVFAIRAYGSECCFPCL